MSKPIKAWYFAPEGNRLGYGDNRPIRIGLTHTVDCTPKACVQGLHASEHIIDALKHANTSNLYRVELSGKMGVGDDKIAAQSRKYLQHYDVESLLHEFARKQALINIEKIKPYCSDSDYQLICDWLTTGKRSLRDAARAAARNVKDKQEQMLLDMITEQFGEVE